MATVDQIRELREDFLNAETVAGCMKIKPDRFREYARNGQLPFPVRISGNRVTVSRTAFLDWVDGKKADYLHENTMEMQFAELIKEIRATNAILLGIAVHYGTGGDDHAESRGGDSVKGYKTFKTTMGHKIRVKMSAEEIYERDMFHAALILAPFLAGILFGLIWLKGW